MSAQPQPDPEIETVAKWCDFLGEEEGKRDPRARDAWRQFRKYHEDRPEVWRLFKKFTLEVIASGQESYGAHAIFQRIRWETEIEQKGQFKVSNTAFPFYARVFGRAFAKYSDFFRYQDKPLTGMSGMD